MPKSNYTAVLLPPDLAAHVLSFPIDPKHLIEREDEPHCTLKFGLQGDHADTKEALKGELPAKFRIGATSLFRNPDADVLKLDVTSTDLHRLHRKLNRLPHDDSHPDYKPHVTIATLRPGTGRYYSGKTVRRLTGRSAIARSVMFAGKDGKKTTIPLEPKGEGEDS